MITAIWQSQNILMCVNRIMNLASPTLGDLIYGSYMILCEAKTSLQTCSCNFQEHLNTLNHGLKYDSP